MKSATGLMGAAVRCMIGVVSPAACALGSITPFTEEAVSRGLMYSIQAYGTNVSLGMGVAIADLNSNGHQDIVLTGAPGGMVGFFENNPRSPGHFVNRSFSSAGTPKFTLSRPSGIAIADYNGDGLLDIYLTQDMDQATGQLFPNFLLRSEGDFTFTNVTLDAGVSNLGNSQAAAWGDFDNDGWLDLYLANYTFPNYALQQAHVNKLFRNLGNETFHEVASLLGVDDKGMTFTPVFTDMNRNGWLDLYIVNDRGHFGGLPPNQLWRNNGGNGGGFENLCGPNPPDTDSSGACIGLWAMCAGAGDVTGNGYPDFYVTNIAHPGGYNGWNAFLVNQGDETFVEQCPQAGVCSLATSWAGIFFDFDNNGWLDIYVCNQTIPNRLYSNDGTFPMANVSLEAAVGGSSGWSYNAAVGDVTGNGALDILLNNYGPQGGAPANVQLFINHEGLKHNWIRFDVAGLPGSGNMHAIGANIEVTAAGHTQWREIYAGGNNYKSQNELVFHFGLGAAEVADLIVVNWPGGEVQRVLSNYTVNNRWTIHPPQVLGDFNSDGMIGVGDLLALLTAWGSVKPGSEIMDITGNGQVGVGDLLALLAKWSGQ